MESEDSNKIETAMARSCPAHKKGSVLNPISFEELCQGTDEIWIECNGQSYRLKKTKQQKLILTK